MMKYINDISKEHQTADDRKEIQDVFRGFEQKNTGLGQMLGLDKKKVQLAYEKLFDEWKIDLTGQ